MLASFLQDHQRNGHETFARQILIDHIRHLSSSRRVNANTATPNRPNDTPPAYEEVVKEPPTAEGNDNQAGNRAADRGSESDGELPSCVEAIEALEATTSHVVTIEVDDDQSAQRGNAAPNADAGPMSIANPNFVEPEIEQLSTPKSKRRLLFAKFGSSERIEMAPGSGRASPVTPYTGRY